MPTTGSALRRSLPAQPAASRRDPAGARSMDAVLRGLPSHGWTSGWVGRRDRALLVLWQRAGLSFAELAALTVQDVVVHDGVATVRVEGADRATLTMTEDGLLCGPCALSRWLHALGLAGARLDGRVVASVIARAAPLTAHSPHVCEGSTPECGPAGSRVFPAEDRWATAPTLPAPAAPVHDLRTRPAHGPRRYAPTGWVRSDVARAADPTVPAVVVEPCDVLENRARALLGGSA